MAEEISPIDDEESAFPAGASVPGQSESRIQREQFLAQREQCPWWQEYMALRAEKWDWRKAAYIAWASSPVLDRWPESQETLAVQVLGLRSDRTIRKWREKDPTIDERVAKMQIEPLLKHRRDVIDALVHVASMPDPKAHPDRRMLLEIIGVYKPKAANTNLDIDLSALSDDQLERIAAGEEPVHVLADARKR